MLAGPQATPASPSCMKCGVVNAKNVSRQPSPVRSATDVPSVGPKPSKNCENIPSECLNGNWSSFQLAKSTSPQSVIDHAIAPSAKIPLSDARSPADTQPMKTRIVTSPTTVAAFFEGARDYTLTGDTRLRLVAFLSIVPTKTPPP